MGAGGYSHLLATLLSSISPYPSQDETDYRNLVSFIKLLGFMIYQRNCKYKIRELKFYRIVTSHIAHLAIYATSLIIILHC